MCDLASGYNQVIAAEVDLQKTVICSTLTSCSMHAGTFEHQMEHIFGDKQFQSLLLPLDDMVGFFPTSFIVEQVFHIQLEVLYFGHISADGVPTNS